MVEQTAPVVIFVLGGPGAGKGTQCANLVKDFSFVHLSAGDLLRAEMAREGSEFGELISTYIKDGQIVPMEVTLKLIQQAMTQSPGSMVLLDGFPRKMDQALEFEKVVAPCKAVLYFTCTEEVMLERLLKRGETSGRSDDNKESIVKRFQTFHETSFPVIQHYAAQSKVIEIDTLDTPDKVYSATKTQIQKLLGIELQEPEVKNVEFPPSKESLVEKDLANVTEESKVESETVLATEEPVVEKKENNVTSNLLPEIQVDNNSTFSEVLGKLSIDSKVKSKDIVSELNNEEPEVTVIETQSEAYKSSETPPEHLPVVAEVVGSSKLPVPEIKDTNESPAVDENQTSRGLHKNAVPAQDASSVPAQETSGPSPKNAKGHSKKKFNCLIM